MSKHEKSLGHTFGHQPLHKECSGCDHLTPHGVIKPHGHEHTPAIQPHRTVHAKHEEVHGAKGMESHGSIHKGASATVPGGKGKPAKIETDMKVGFRPSM